MWPVFDKEAIKVGPNSMELMTLDEKEFWTDTYREKMIRRPREKTVSYLQAKERILGQIFPSQPSEGNNHADTLISDFQPP